MDATGSNRIPKKHWRNFMKVINPATEVSEHLEETSLEHIPTRVDLARQQQPAWGEYPLEMRVAILSKWPELVEAKRNHIAHYMTQDMGKPLANSQKEIDATLAHYQFFCRQATFQENQPVR